MYLQEIQPEWLDHINLYQEFKMSAILYTHRPEMNAGGFARDDGFVSLYQRVDALINSDMTVLDLGCGRGEQFHTDSSSYRTKLARLQGRVAKLIGVDIDSAVFEHPFLDERHVMRPGGSIPIESESVDLIVSDWVLEHIESPDAFASEVERVLKPHGWLCARTPNYWSYVAIAARIIPTRAHTGLLSKLMPKRESRDVFPAYYRLNTMRALRDVFPPSTWMHCSFMESTTPKYYGESSLIFKILDVYQSIVPSALKTNLMVFMRKS